MNHRTMDDVSAVSYISSAFTATWGFFADNPIGWIGVFIGLGTLLINWYYKHQDEQRKRERQAMQAEAIRLYHKRMERGQDVGRPPFAGSDLGRLP